jgi:hypothetical protein
MNWEDIIKNQQLQTKVGLTTDLRPNPFDEKPKDKEEVKPDPPKPKRNTCKEKLIELHGYTNNQLKDFMNMTKQNIGGHVNIENYSFGRGWGAEINMLTSNPDKKQKKKKRKGKGVREDRPRMKGQWKHTLSRHSKEMLEESKWIFNIDGDGFRVKEEEMACLLLHAIANAKTEDKSYSKNQLLLISDRSTHISGILIYGVDLQNLIDRDEMHGSPTRLTYNEKTRRISFNIESSMFYYKLEMAYNKELLIRMDRYSQTLDDWKSLLNDVISKAKELVRSI